MSVYVQSAIAFALLVLAGWTTHIIVCIQTSQWLLLIAGAIAAPVGVVHGWGLWFGAWG
jgi:hypothetical protein